ncbi:deoxyuridine 5'-triphosphate nucleotidohydrolase Dut [Methylobacterium sp. 4-46]|uniref:dUTP diphosphatase n=1 Tax=unclassified Methylobacterium TaxID=2615210 RepID=UPI000152D265|nr:MULTISPECIES: dUTP diphosphatase [Methylobacterium]ACA19363.1 deoxyuridine 5'-triphosphate nucleotidohydrolase Dut [Methylobacterium sp. 4-46]WFT78562.1 dUTP diphosphatase [Methylobacterium nodulans]
MTGPDDLAVEIRLLDPRLSGWGFPRWGSAQAAGLDLHACLDAPLTLAPQAAPVLVPAGFAVAIRDPGWCGLVCPRSGLGHREGLVLGNTVGVIDADYEGPLMLSLWNRNPPGASRPLTIAPGERVAQLVFTRVTRPALRLVETFSGEAAARGESGFGSTGRH